MPSVGSGSGLVAAGAIFTLPERAILSLLRTVSPRRITRILLIADRSHSERRRRQRQSFAMVTLTATAMPVAGFFFAAVSEHLVGMIGSSINPAIKDYAGWDLITSDGTTLLGADDKAGVADIMTACSAAGSGFGDIGKEAFGQCPRDGRDVHGSRDLPRTQGWPDHRGCHPHRHHGGKAIRISKGFHDRTGFPSEASPLPAWPSDVFAPSQSCQELDEGSSSRSEKNTLKIQVKRDDNQFVPSQRHRLDSRSSCVSFWGLTGTQKRGEDPDVFLQRFPKRLWLLRKWRGAPGARSEWEQRGKRRQGANESEERCSNGSSLWLRLSSS